MGKKRTSRAVLKSPAAAKKRNKKRKTGREREDEMDKETGPLWVGKTSKHCQEQWERAKRPSNFSSQTQHHTVMQLVVQEVARCDVIVSLRDKLQRLCGKGTATARYPSLGFERWLLNAKAMEVERGGIAVDPVLPTHSSIADAVLLADLLKMKFTKTQAENICVTLANEVQGAIASLVNHEGLKGASVREVKVKVKSTPLGLELRLGTHAIHVPTDALDKLRQLYRGAPESLFILHAFRMLLRYQTIGGLGFQASIPASAFTALHEHFGVQMEMFASPLNCFHGSFCSAFVDVDAVFGSCGSFLEWEVDEGSFEANPPFAPALMKLMVVRMEVLLTASVKPLSFAVVLPAWKNTESWALLENSVFNTGLLSVDKDEHMWRQTGHPNKACVARKVPCDTVIFFLQNQQGARKWALDQEKIGFLKEAIRM